MIEVEHLTHYYGAHRALADVSLRIADREIVGFLGLNGAGKSTMLKILAGILLPSAGRVRIGDQDADASSVALRRRIGFLPDEPPLYREMRVGEYLRWCGQIRGRSVAEVERELPSVLETCQLAGEVNTVIDALSYGYRKRVGIAQAIIHRPDLVLLDEPISGLDPVQIKDMRAVVRSLKERATVLISSHILSEIAQTCDRILVLHDGALVAEGTEAGLAARLGGGQRLEVELRGARAAAEDAVASVDGVELLAVREAPQALVLELRLDAEGPEALVAALVERGLGVRRVEPMASELEDIFIGLTRSPGGANGTDREVPA